MSFPQNLLQVAEEAFINKHLVVIFEKAQNNSLARRTKISYEELANSNNPIFNKKQMYLKKSDTIILESISDQDRFFSEVAKKVYIGPVQTEFTTDQLFLVWDEKEYVRVYLKLGGKNGKVNHFAGKNYP